MFRSRRLTSTILTALIAGFAFSAVTFSGASADPLARRSRISWRSWAAWAGRHRAPRLSLSPAGLLLPAARGRLRGAAAGGLCSAAAGRLSAGAGRRRAAARRRRSSAAIAAPVPPWVPPPAASAGAIIGATTSHGRHQWAGNGRRRHSRRAARRCGRTRGRYPRPGLRRASRRLWSGRPAGRLGEPRLWHAVSR